MTRGLIASWRQGDGTGLDAQAGDRGPPCFPCFFCRSVAPQRALIGGRAAILINLPDPRQPRSVAALDPHDVGRPKVGHDTRFHLAVIHPTFFQREVAPLPFARFPLPRSPATGEREDALAPRS